MTQFPSDDKPLLNETRPGVTPILDTDQHADQPTNWVDHGPHRPYERGILGSLVRKVREALTPARPRPS